MSMNKFEKVHKVQDELLKILNEEVTNAPMPRMTRTKIRRWITNEDMVRGWAIRLVEAYEDE